MVVYSWEASGSTAAWPADQEQANHAAAALHPRTPTDMFAATTHSKSLVIQAAPLGVPQGQVPRSCHEQCAAADVSGSAGTCSAPHTHAHRRQQAARGGFRRQQLQASKCGCCQAAAQAGMLQPTLPRHAQHCRTAVLQGATLHC